MAWLVKKLTAVQETWVRFLGQEDLLEEGMATHSSILASRIPWTEEPGGLQSIGFQEQDTTERTQPLLVDVGGLHLGHATHFSFCDGSTPVCGSVKGISWALTLVGFP